MRDGARSGTAGRASRAPSRAPVAKHRTAGHGDQIAAAPREVSDFEATVDGARVKLGAQAVAPCPAGDDGARIGHLDAGNPAQGLEQGLRLEPRLDGVVEMLEIAAAAAGIVGTGRLAPARPRRQKLHDLGPAVVRLALEQARPDAISRAPSAARRSEFPRTGREPSPPATSFSMVRSSSSSSERRRPAVGRS